MRFAASMPRLPKPSPCETYLPRPGVRSDTRARSLVPTKVIEQVLASQMSLVQAYYRSSDNRSKRRPACRLDPVDSE
jgi:hypothetical protein